MKESVTTGIITKKRRSPLLIFFLLIMFALSIVLRLWQYDDKNNYVNIDASYHMLLTIESMKENPISTHKLLPIVTLGNDDDKYIPWGATIPDNNGNYFYTSFPQLGFVVPWVIFSIFHLPLTINSLMGLSLCIYFFACIACFIFAIRVLKSCGVNNKFNEIAATILTLIYMFNNEAFYSHGVIYWSQSLYQLFWLIQLIIFSCIMDEKIIGKHNKAVLISFFIISFVCPATEWTGYIANFGIFAVLIYKFIKNKEKIYKTSIIIIAVGTMLAFLWFALSFLAINNMHTIIAVINSRFSARALNNHNILQSMIKLILSYIESFGPYLLSLYIFIVSFYFFKDKFVTAGRSINRNEKMWIFITLFPMIENIILMQHATSYTFDRLKLIIFIIAITAILYLHIKERRRWCITAFIGASIVVSIIQFVSVTYVFNKNNYQISNKNTFTNRLENIYKRSWPISNISFNDVMKLYLSEYDNAVFAQQYAVRGYSNITFNRGIYENVSDEDTLRNLTYSRRKTQAVWLLCDNDNWSMYVYNNALIYDFTKDKVTIIGIINGSDIDNGILKVRKELIPYIKIRKV